MNCGEGGIDGMGAMWGSGDASAPGGKIPRGGKLGVKLDIVSKGRI